MRTLFDTEEEEEVKASEITLSTASLLGIFFGLVLICGVFFGFGYSMGRGTGQRAQAHALENIPASTPGDGDEAEAARRQQPRQRSRLQRQSCVGRGQKDAAAEETPRLNRAPRQQTRSTEIGSGVCTAGRRVSFRSGKPMVQIAAVARPEDAYVLVNALRQRGYSVVVRNEPQDKLLHVQVGPFADLTQAAAMKQKLLSDGYNAIIKQ